MKKVHTSPPDLFNSSASCLTASSPRAIRAMLYPALENVRLGLESVRQTSFVVMISKRTQQMRPFLTLFLGLRMKLKSILKTPCDMNSYGRPAITKTCFPAAVAMSIWGVFLEFISVTVVTSIRQHQLTSVYSNSSGQSSSAITVKLTIMNQKSCQ